MIDHLNEQRNFNGFGVGHIYFEYQEQKQQTRLAVVASLVKQLLSQIPGLPGEFPKDIETKYQEKKTQHPSTEDLITMLLAMPKWFSRVFVVCDALDEMDQREQRDHLLPLFHRLKDSGVALFLTTRPHPADIQESFRDASIIELTPKIHDVRQYVEGRLSANRTFKELRDLPDPSGIYGHAVSKIVDSAAGVYEKLPSFEFMGTKISHRFLLAKFNVDYILEFPTVPGIRRALTNLSIPETMAVGITSERENERRMDETYDRIIDSIRKKPQGIQKYAFRALSWIGYATRTLTIQELLVSISVEAEQYQLNDSDIYRMEDLLDICNGLIVANKDGRAVHLVHFSARNYLDRHQVIPEDTKETYRAITCSTYLSFDMLKEQHCPSQSLGELKRCLPFLDYAANNLMFHLSKVQHRQYPEITSSVLKLLEDKGHRRAYCEAKKEIATPLDIPRLSVACEIGYEEAVRALLKESKDALDVNAKDAAKGLTPLSWAARMGHEAVVKQLLDDDRVDRNCKDSEGRTPLSWAIREHKTGIVRLLLEKGVEVNFVYREPKVMQFDNK